MRLALLLLCAAFGSVAPPAYVGVPPDPSAEPGASPAGSGWEESLDRLAARASADILADGVPPGTEHLVLVPSPNCCGDDRVVAVGKGSILGVWRYGSDGTFHGQTADEPQLTEHVLRKSARRDPRWVRPPPVPSDTGCTVARAARAARGPLAAGGYLGLPNSAVVAESDGEGWHVRAVHSRQGVDLADYIHTQLAEVRVDSACVLGEVQPNRGPWSRNDRATYAMAKGALPF